MKTISPTSTVIAFKIVQTADPTVPGVDLPGLALQAYLTLSPSGTAITDLVTVRTKSPPDEAVYLVGFTTAQLSALVGLAGRTIYLYAFGEDVAVNIAYRVATVPIVSS